MQKNIDQKWDDSPAAGRVKGKIMQEFIVFSHMGMIWITEKESGDKVQITIKQAERLIYELECAVSEAKAYKLRTTV